MSAAEIAAALGGARRSGLWWRCVCPVHGSRTGRSLTLALRDHARGLAVHCHAGCNRDDIIAELRRRGLITGHIADARPAPLAVRGGNRGDTAWRTALGRRIWNAATDARGTPVARYLAGRGITIAVPPCLRWLPACRHPSGIYLPAMVARVDNVDGELIALHRTFLQADGNGKANIDPQKASLGPVGGGAVRLATTAETLLIGEGIETVLAATRATGQPAWAALSTSGMMALALPTVVRTIIILADNDSSGAGQRAAEAAAQRLRRERREVSVWMSPHVGTDANDLLVFRGKAGKRHAA